MSDSQRPAPSPQPPAPSGHARTTLLAVRTVWALDIALQVLLAAAACAVALVHPYTGYPRGRTMLLVATWAIFVVATPVGLFLRNQIYKAHWQGQAVTPKGYAVGSAVMSAALELVTVCSIAAVLLTPWWVLIGPAAASIGIYAVNFPHGKPMRPHPPRT